VENDRCFGVLILRCLSSMDGHAIRDMIPRECNTLFQDMRLVGLECTALFEGNERRRGDGSHEVF
jgi:hypothetical protein